GQIDRREEEHAAFGEVVDGIVVVTVMEIVGTKNGEPRSIVKVKKCGVV
ncbi:hypothetical protein GH890_31670, partial [Bacillus thuringiensis]|nr:hypothetical protein [Bacillus thuringiensis]